MESSNFIYQKLEAFIRKFYWNELIRGIVFFIGLGLLYFLFTLLIEYFLWLQPAGRMLLFWFFLVVEGFLFLRFILFPIFKLLKFQKGLDYKQASDIIGKHFANVNDTLTNFIQLSGGTSLNNKSELLLASIDQKANALVPISFNNAINFKANKRYLPLVIVPILVFCSFYLTGNNKVIAQSLNRVVHFNTPFSPPAPFQFKILNSNLRAEQNIDFTLKVKTIGKIVPENIMIYVGNESYFLENTSNGNFQFKLSKPSSNLNFHLEANGVTSPEYELKVVVVPSILNFEMILKYPYYLNRNTDVIQGTGNAIVPEGTVITWRMKTEATTKVQWLNDQISYLFNKSDFNFVLSKKIMQNTEYQVITSNSNINNYEKLSYQLSVVKDQYPSIQVSNVPDSLKIDKRFVLGKISDDYGLSKLHVVYYPKSNPLNVKRGTIAIKSSPYDQFVFLFPSNLPVDQGVSYEYYFEVFDNDGLHNFKRSKSSVFSNRVETDSEKEDQILEEQNDNIKGLENSLKIQNKQLSVLDKLQKVGKEKEKFEFKEQQDVNDFIKRQKQQDELMKQFADKMKDNLEKFKSKNEDEFKDALQIRLDKADKDIDNNKKLLDELKELNDKIRNEDLLFKLDKFKQNSKNQVKNLQQLVELTKKYYVDKKAEQLASKLEALAKKQEVLSNNEKDNSSKNQNDINSDFRKIQEELKELKKDNQELKSPLDLPDDSAKENSIEDDLMKAFEELDNNNRDRAKPKQKNAAKNMKGMAMKMTQSLEESASNQMKEDVKMLRQILDNLLAFSLSQEDLMSDFKALKSGSPAFNKKIKWQQDLKQQFKHVDDSLFSMSLRNPKIAEDVTREIGNLQYNIDKSLETLTDNQIAKGISHQQYTISFANKLGDFLSEILNGMQMSLSGQGGGKPKPGEGSGMQLPDIIKKQEGIGDKIKKGIQSGLKSGDGPKSSKGESNSDDEGEGEGNAKAILGIYKEQQKLRETLENELYKQGLSNQGQGVLDQMKQVEKQLLNKGFKNETLQRALNIKQELLKLKTALQQQGEENKRQSHSNIKDFNNESKPLPGILLDYLNSIEILNRQSLPLRSNFNQKVQEYFNKK